MGKTKILKGNICFSIDKDTIIAKEKAYLVWHNNTVDGVFEKLPRKYRKEKVTDYGDCMIIPGLTDLHMHAPQYTFRSLGMDMELLEWLNTNTFPEEARYDDLGYAKKAYAVFAHNMKRSATTRACIFATCHRKATEVLMDRMEDTGLQTMVGKVNMDRDAPFYLCEKSARDSLDATRKWLRRTEGRYRNVVPILTPRFTPSCTDELLKGLGDLRGSMDLPVQSHLSENPAEIELVRKLCPWSDFYGDTYDKSNLMGPKTIMAHCVYSGEAEQQLMKARGVYIAHCPESNANLASGIAPVRKYLNDGQKIGLGSDIAGGTTESIFRAMVLAIQLSKIRWRYVDSSLEPLSAAEAFYLATKGGGSFFGNVGSFEKGYEADVLVINDKRLLGPDRKTVRQRLERIFYLSDKCEIKAKYAAGRRIF